MNGITGAWFNVVVCIGVPVGMLLFLLLFKRRYLPAFLVGAATFGISQLLLRLPMLDLLARQAWYQRFYVAMPVLGTVLISFSAALFEEGGRWLSMRFLLKKQRSFTDGITFGFGHGGLEAAWHCWTYSVVLLQTQSLLLRYQPFIDVAIAGIERILVIVMHIGMSLLVLKAVRDKKPLWLLFSMGVHTGFNCLVLLSLLGVGIWGIEIAMAIAALAMLIAILAMKKQWKGEKRDEKAMEPVARNWDAGNTGSLQ